MMSNHWLFTKEEIMNSPNMKLLADPEQELKIKLGASTLVQQIGERLQISTHCICIALVYVHRLYMHFNFEEVDPKKIAMVAVHLAAKTHNEPRKLEYFLKTAYSLLNPQSKDIDVKSELYTDLKEEITGLESVMLSVLGFQLNVELPHPHIVRLSEAINGETCDNHKSLTETFFTLTEPGNIELTKKAYFICTASIMATTMCLQYEPTLVACLCVNLASRWSRIQIEPVNLEKPWYCYADPFLTEENFNNLTNELGENIMKAAKYVDSPLLKSVLPSVERPQATRQCLTENSSETNSGESSEKTFSMPNFFMGDLVIGKPMKTQQTNKNDEKIKIVPVETSLTPISKHARHDENTIGIKDNIPRNFVYVK